MTGYLYYLKAILYYLSGKKHNLRTGEDFNPLHRTMMEMLRRRYLLIFRRSYIEKSLKERKGACLQCGTCCRTMLMCPYLKDGNTCELYPDKLRETCLRYPFDTKDQELSETIGKCGYCWV